MPFHAPILILTAVVPELKPIAKAFRARKPRPDQKHPALTQAHHRVTAGSHLHFLATGMGPARAAHVTTDAITILRPQAVITTGVAGGLAPGLHIGDLIEPARLTFADDGWQIVPSLDIVQPRAGSLLTSSRVATSVRDKTAAFREFHTAAIDMESAAIGRTCDEARIPWHCIRAISDPADIALPPAFATLVTHDGRPAIGRSIKYLARRPHHIKKLITLGRDTKYCAKRLAERLKPLVEFLDQEPK